jgi:hypothetical protein
MHIVWLEVAKVVAIDYKVSPSNSRHSKAKQIGDGISVSY